MAWPWTCADIALRLIVTSGFGRVGNNTNYFPATVDNRTARSPSWHRRLHFNTQRRSGLVVLLRNLAGNPLALMREDVHRKALASREFLAAQNQAFDGHGESVEFHRLFGKMLGIRASDNGNVGEPVQQPKLALLTFGRQWQ